jgi:hypothetical protein
MTYQVRTYNPPRLFHYGLLLTLTLFASSACTKSMGPRLDKHAVPYEVDKPTVTAKVETAKAISETAKPIIPISIVKTTRPSKVVKVATPCDMADPGYGIYHPWKKNLKMGRMLMPKKKALTADGGFDLIIHFHGGNAVRKTIVDIARGVYIAAVDLGAGSSAYERPFTKPGKFLSLLKDVEKAVARDTNNKRAHIRKLGLTGWSAGYGAIRAILRQKASARVDAVVLIDGLHSNYSNASRTKLRSYQLKPFVSFARHAAKGDKFMFVSHSSIVPPGYASTTETAHYLAEKLGARVHESSVKESPLLSRYEQAQSGGFLMRGYLGKGKTDHCAQIALMAGAVGVLEEWWKTPQAESRNISANSRPVDGQASELSIAGVYPPGQQQKQPENTVVARGG